MPIPTDITLPMVHLNGTSKSELEEQQMKMYQAADSLILAMRAARPNARDYYVIDNGAYLRACAEFEVLVTNAVAIRDHAYAVMIHLFDS